MGWFSSGGNPDEHVVLPAGKSALTADRGPTMHETHSEWNLMAGRGALIRWSGHHVQVTGEKPGRQR